MLNCQMCSVDAITVFVNLGQGELLQFILFNMTVRKNTKYLTWEEMCIVVSSLFIRLLQPRYIILADDCAKT